MHVTFSIIGQWPAEPNDATGPGAMPFWEAFGGPIILMAGLAAVGAIVVALLRRRRQSLQSFAGRHGLQPRDLANPGEVWEQLESLLGRSALFKAGYVVKVDAWYHGRVDGFEAHVVDFREYGVLGNRRETEAQAYYGDERYADQGETFLVFRGERLSDLPRFMIVPNHPLLRAMGPKHDVVLTSDDRFNKVNRITSPEQDAEATEQMMTERLIDVLARNRTMSVESTEDVLVFCRYSTRLGAEGAEQLLARARQVMSELGVGRA